MIPAASFLYSGICASVGQHIAKNACKSFANSELTSNAVAKLIREGAIPISIIFAAGTGYCASASLEYFVMGSVRELINEE